MRDVKKNPWVSIFILFLLIGPLTILGFGFPLSSFPLLWRLGSSLDKKNNLNTESLQEEKLSLD